MTLDASMWKRLTLPYHEKMTLPYDYALDIVLFFVGVLLLCINKKFPLDHVL